MSSHALPLLTVAALQLWAAHTWAEGAASSDAPAVLVRDDRALARWVGSRSPDVEAGRAELRAQRAAASGTRLYLNPTVDLGVGNVALGQTNPPDYPRSKTLQYNVGISQTVELGKRSPRIQAAELTATAAQARLQWTIAERIGVARGALAELIYATLRVQQLDASLQEARAAGLVAQGRLEHHDISGVDYDRMLIDFATLETAHAHALADAQMARAQCNAALQAPCDVAGADVADLDRAAPVPANPGPDIDLRDRADLRALSSEAAASSESAQLAAARAWPDLTFRLGYTHDAFTIAGSLANSLSLSVAAPLPVFDRGQYAQNEALARASQVRSLARAEQVRAQGQLEGLYARKRAVEDALKNLEEQTLPRANGVLEAEELGLKEGQLDLNDLLLARRAAIAVRLQTLELHYELFQVRNALRQVLGLDQRLIEG